MDPTTEIPFGRFYEDFAKAAIYHHSVRKTITESDNNLFCLLTMNHHPVHLDQDYAGKAQHGRVLVVGTLVFSIAVGLTVADISGRAIANLSYENVTHDGPVHIGDTIHAETEVLELRESKSRKDRGIAYVETRVFNQANVKVLTFRRSVLIPKRSATISGSSGSL